MDKTQGLIRPYTQPSHVRDARFSFSSRYPRKLRRTDKSAHPSVACRCKFRFFDNRFSGRTAIYRYITEKRLIYAHNLITNNNPPTKIYLDCGYRDYTSFYRAFVKMFGYPPSQTKPD
ncbi:MAG: AraC family transcriptional regulator [Oscillospiraceae bacterium]|nr:AraC family transcriptional regulator [Oscillospiraceae bacterium]